ncbi:MAG: DHH family phosphoesterase [Pirellulaceae bacterium]|nr:DHH family phosphoesterase [Pirellulaceae bacterium]
MPINWPRFVEIVNRHNHFLLTSHIRPDCDALGSELGMAGILESMGKSVRIVNGQQTPSNLAFIDPNNKIEVINENVQLTDLEDVEVLMVLDTSAWAQLGPMGDVLRATKAKKIVIDHHVSEDELGTEPFKNTTAEATGRLVVEAAEALNVELTPEIAMPVFAALATDTGWYRFGSTTSETFRTGAKLIDAGAKPADIYRELYERDTLGRLRLRGNVLARTATELNGRLAHTFILKEDFETTGAHPSDTEDLVNQTLAIDGTEAAVILVEQLSGGFKISFRSRCKMDCSQVAETFGGGGHKAAAGAFIDEPFETAQDKVLDAVRTEMR